MFQGWNVLIWPCLEKYENRHTDGDTFSNSVLGLWFFFLANEGKSLFSILVSIRTHSVFYNSTTFHNCRLSYIIASQAPGPSYIANNQQLLKKKKKKYITWGEGGALVSLMKKFNAFLEALNMSCDMYDFVTCCSTHFVPCISNYGC